MLTQAQIDHAFAVSQTKNISFMNANQNLVCSPDYIAALLSPLLASEYRYDPKLKKWFRFNGKLWDEYNGFLGDIRIYVRMCRMWMENTAKPATGRYALKIDTTHTTEFFNSVVHMCEKESDLHINAETDFDVLPHFINTPDGYIDLTSGQMFKHSAGRMLSMMTNISPKDDKDGTLCPNYVKHLDFVSAGEVEVRTYLENLSGYVLTGDISQQEFYFWHGHGNNGKTKLINIWKHILGSYAANGVAGQFSSEGRSQHKEADARLRGKRLVVGEEIGGNSPWDISKLKTFTGDSSLAVRAMHGSTFEYDPVCKLIFLSNKKPKLDSNDYGISRRLRLITFKERIPDAMRDIYFGDKLKKEAPYIMYRMVKAAYRYFQAKTLNTPEIIKAASMEYIADENVAQIFIEDNCDINPYEHISCKEFFNKLNAWCFEQGLDTPTKKAVESQVESLGYNRVKGMTNMRVYKGITWKAGIDLKEFVGSGDLGFQYN